jgi:hypothetical protein
VRPAGSARYRPTVDSDGNERARKSGPDVRSAYANLGRWDVPRSRSFMREGAQESIGFPAAP